MKAANIQSDITKVKSKNELSRLLDHAEQEISRLIRQNKNKKHSEYCTHLNYIDLIRNSSAIELENLIVGVHQE